MQLRPLILITGSSGLIGTRVLADLARDHRVVGLDLEMPDMLPPHATYMSVDLTDDTSVRTAFERIARTHGTKIASVIHLAAYYDFSGAPSPLYQELTVEGTRRLLRELRRFDVEQLVFSSTVLVMREAEEGEVITERSPVEAEWEYPRSKLETEELLQRERGDIPVVILRLAGVYDEGGHSPPITQQLARIYERQLESHLFPGDQDHAQPFIHLEDVVSLMRRIVERRAELDDYEVFLAAEPELMSYRDLQDRLGQLIHGEDQWTTLRIPAPIAKAGAWAKDALTAEDAFIKPWMIDLADAHLPVSCERLERKLGWRARHRLDETLAEMVVRLEQDPESFYRENGLAS